MAFADQAALADDVAFRAKVRVALATAAVQTMGEAKGDASDANFGKRQALAKQVLDAAASGSLLEACVWAVVPDPAITNASTDAAIYNAVVSVFGDLAGVRSTD